MNSIRNRVRTKVPKRIDPSIHPVIHHVTHDLSEMCNWTAVAFLHLFRLPAPFNHYFTNPSYYYYYYYFALLHHSFKYAELITNKSQLSSRCHVTFFSHSIGSVLLRLSDSSRRYWPWKRYGIDVSMLTSSFSILINLIKSNWSRS